KKRHKHPANADARCKIKVRLEQQPERPERHKHRVPSHEHTYCSGQEKRGRIDYAVQRTCQESKNNEYHRTGGEQDDAHDLPSLETALLLRWRCGFRLSSGMLHTAHEFVETHAEHLAHGDELVKLRD